MRPVPVRLRDWKEVYEDFDRTEVMTQASRCMDCGIPFCNQGCPLGNLIPDWNDLVYKDDWQRAIDSLHATNNFPEWTGRLCPAPCEGACVAGINTDAVTIKNIELNIIEKAWEEGWVTPVIASKKTGKSVAVIGSGPAGLAAAQQLTRAGHDVTVYERAPKIGGLLRYGIPEFKMEKRFIDRRLEQMEAEGTRFVTNAYVGGPEGHPDRVSAEELDQQFDAVIISTGATNWRDMPGDFPGRDLEGIHQAMEYLPPANAIQMGDLDDHPINAKDKAVIIIGGGDTGADCLGTANRQGAKSVHMFEIMPKPPENRAAGNPWPTWPLIFRTASAHDEGVERVYQVQTTEFVGDGTKITHLKGHKVDVSFDGGRPSFDKVDGSEFTLEADLVFLAMGFTGPEQHTAVAELDLELTERGNVERDMDWRSSRSNVYVCGDSGRGQSLIVWAIAEGRACAASVDADLMGSTLLPSPVKPTDRPL
jgi:glutamate synthase (NADPH/NADH) small chain